MEVRGIGTYWKSREQGNKHGMKGIPDRSPKYGTAHDSPQKCSHALYIEYLFRS